LRPGPTPTHSGRTEEARAASVVPGTASETEDRSSGVAVADVAGRTEDARATSVGVDVTEDESADSNGGVGDTAGQMGARADSVGVAYADASIDTNESAGAGDAPLPQGPSLAVVVLVPEMEAHPQPQAEAGAGNVAGAGAYLSAIAKRRLVCSLVALSVLIAGLCVAYMTCAMTPLPDALTPTVPGLLPINATTRPECVAAFNERALNCGGLRCFVAGWQLRWQATCTDQSGILGDGRRVHQCKGRSCALRHARLAIFKKLCVGRFLGDCQCPEEDWVGTMEEWINGTEV